MSESEPSRSSPPAGSLTAETLNPPLSAAKVPITERYARLGWMLIFLSGLLWAPLPVLPFLDLPTGLKVTIGTGLFVGVQIAWWGGSVLAGPSAVRRVYGWMRKAMFWKREENPKLK